MVKEGRADTMQAAERQGGLGVGNVAHIIRQSQEGSGMEGLKF